MKTLIKTTLVAAVAMAGFSSFTASACNPWQPCVRTEVHVSRSVILPPPPPVCHYEWQEEWRYDAWGNGYWQRYEVRVCR